MKDNRDFATFPHFFRDTIRLYRHTNILYLNSVSGNSELFIKRNFRVRLLTNTVFPGAYEHDLALIENDHFLFNSVDIRRLQQIADNLNFSPASPEMSAVNGVSLPRQLWEYWKEMKLLPVFERTPYHRATLHHYMMQVSKYYLNGDGKDLRRQPLSDIARYYLREIKRSFRGNREVNEAYLRMDRETIHEIAARILVADIPPTRGYEGLPIFLQLREVLLNEDFSLAGVLPPEYFFGSYFPDEEMYLNWMKEYFEHCQHIEFWLLIVRSEGMLEGLTKMLEGLGRRSRVFSYAISSNRRFIFLLSQRG